MSSPDKTFDLRSPKARSECCDLGSRGIEEEEPEVGRKQEERMS